MIFHGRFALRYITDIKSFISPRCKGGMGQEKSMFSLGVLTRTQSLLQLTFRLLVHLVESPFEGVVSEYALTSYMTKM